MPFLNEQDEPVKTLYSLYETAPSDLFNVIAIDDCSDKTSELVSLADYGNVFSDMTFVRNNERLENACQRGLHFNLLNFKNIESILKSKLDQQPLLDEEEKTSTLPQHHENIRGADYYEQRKQGEKNVETPCH